MASVPFNLEYEIPSYRLVEIYNHGETDTIITHKNSLQPIPLIMNDDFSIKIQSKYGQLWEASPNNFMNLLSSTFNIPSGQFSLQGVQIWQSTDPIDISFTASLEMDTDPYYDVIEPTFILMQTCLPEEDDFLKNSTNGTIQKINENLKLKTLIPPGPNVQAILKSMNDDNSSTSKDKYKANGVFDVKIGFLRFNEVIITNVEPTFSKTYAESNAKNSLLPSKVDLSISMSTMKIPTTDMITQMLQAIQ